MFTHTNKSLFVNIYINIYMYIYSHHILILSCWQLSGNIVFPNSKMIAENNVNHSIFVKYALLKSNEVLRRFDFDNSCAFSFILTYLYAHTDINTRTHSSSPVRTPPHICTHFHKRTHTVFSWLTFPSHVLTMRTNMVCQVRTFRWGWRERRWELFAS